MKHINAREKFSQRPRILIAVAGGYRLVTLIFEITRMFMFLLYLIPMLVNKSFRQEYVDHFIQTSDEYLKSRKRNHENNNEQE